MSSATTLLVPSLKPIRLRGVVCATSVLDVRPKPICDHRSTAVPRAMRARLRIAWKHTLGSFEHACTARSPSLRAGSIVSPANSGMSTSASGRCDAMPNRSTPSLVNSVAPKPNVIVSDDGPSPTASPVSSGGASWSVLSLPTGSPAVMRRAARVHSRSRSITSSRSAGGEVEAGEEEAVLCRGDDPRLVLAVERHHGVESGGRCRGRRRAQHDVGADDGGSRRGRGERADGAEEPAP